MCSRQTHTDLRMEEGASLTATSYPNQFSKQKLKDAERISATLHSGRSTQRVFQIQLAMANLTSNLRWSHPASTATGDNSGL